MPVLARIRARKAAVLAAVVAALAVSLGGTAVAVAVTVASPTVYTACQLKATGTIRIIDPSLGAKALLGHCTKLEKQIEWNAAGQPGPAGADGADGATGADGVGVTTQAEPAGANCPAGGVKITAADGDSYVCNGVGAGVRKTAAAELRVSGAGAFVNGYGIESVRAASAPGFYCLKPESGIDPSDRFVMADPGPTGVSLYVYRFDLACADDEFTIYSYVLQANGSTVPTASLEANVWIP